MNATKEQLARFEKIESELENFPLRGKFSTYGYIRNVFIYLRKNMHLCKISDYQKLYNECLDYLHLYTHIVCNWNEDHPKNQRDWLEFMADMEGKLPPSVCPIPLFTGNEVEPYLSYRRQFWNSENT